MARAPFQVLVYPYRKIDDNEYEYALLKRSDAGWWQAIAGGGEDDETPTEAAKREAYEEAGILTDSSFLQNDLFFCMVVFAKKHKTGYDYTCARH